MDEQKTKEDQNLADVLNHISEVAKRLAKRFRVKGEKNGNQD